MNQIAKIDTKHATALESIRRTICMAPPGEELLLHETALTEQYGMSRTPIRQILQRLAYERLVETKSGVGTAVVSLREEHRGRDLLVHRGIMQAVLPLGIARLTIAQHSDILALAGIASMIEDGDRDLQFDLRHRLHDMLSSLIPDPILLDTFSASYWRIVRWHMHDLTVDPAGTSNAMRNLITQIAGYQSRDGADLFLRAVEAEFL